MAVTMADITKLRKMTGAGMMDCKNALTEAEGDFDKAMEIIRKKGQAVAAKRSEREASEGCVLAKTTGDRAVIVALKCETDFVAQNADFVKLTQDILDLAVANKCKTLEEVKALPMGNGTVQDAVVDRSGITGEKMELDGYMTVEGVCTAVYNHMNRNGLCTIVAFNKEVNEQLAKQIAMQIAAMNPIAIDEDGVSEEVKQKEIEVAIEKTKAEQVQKAVEAALKLKDATGCKVVVITMGPPPAQGMLRELMAMGADEGILVSAREFGGSDTFATSQILAAAIKKYGVDADDSDHLW